MFYIKVQDGEFVEKLSQSNIEWDSKHLQTAASLTDEERKQFGVCELIATDYPTYDEATQRIVELSPECREGIWYQAWDVVDLTSEELEERVRSEKENVPTSTLLERIERVEAALGL